MEFTVKRSEWARGGKDSVTLLYSPVTKHRCCLGFFGLACGITDTELAEEGTLASITPHRDLLISNGMVRRAAYANLGINTDAALDLMETNDNSKIDDTERESKLTTQFATLGHTVLFVD